MDLNLNLLVTIYLVCGVFNFVVLIINIKIIKRSSHRRLNVWDVTWILLGPFGTIPLVMFFIDVIIDRQIDLCEERKKEKSKRTKSR